MPLHPASIREEPQGIYATYNDKTPESLSYEAFRIIQKGVLLPQLSFVINIDLLLDVTVSALPTKICLLSSLYHTLWCFSEYERNKSPVRVLKSTANLHQNLSRPMLRVSPTHNSTTNDKLVNDRQHIQERWRLRYIYDQIRQREHPFLDALLESVRGRVPQSTLCRTQLISRIISACVLRASSLCVAAVVRQVWGLMSRVNASYPL